MLEIILPMIYLDNMDCNFDRRGLKIDNITKVLIALRFYASGNDQVFECNLNEYLIMVRLLLILFNCFIESQWRYIRIFTSFGFYCS